MALEKTTIMVLKVDLQCSCCYKKVKKVLCKFPREIKDQVFDEKANTVTITVVCCNPEKIRDKLYCKGGKAIKCIDIKDPPKVDKKTKEEPEKQKSDDKGNKQKSEDKGDKQKSDDKGDKKKSDGKVDKPEPVISVAVCCGQCYDGYGGGPCHRGFGWPVPPPPGPCYDGYGGGPCHLGFGRPVPPPPGPCYDGYGYGGKRVHYVTRCDYFSEENATGCSIM